MNVDRNPKAFNYLFKLFVEMGEQQLGRKLTSNQILELKQTIAQKCSDIPKSQIIKQIYDLELAKHEKKMGHLNALQRYKLRQHVGSKTNSPVKLSSPSTKLSEVVANKFARAELSEFISYDNRRTIKPPSKETIKTLRDSYVTDTFRYKAPLGTKDILIRLGTLAAGATLAFTLYTSVPKTPVNSTPETTISENQTVENQNENTTLESTIKKDILSDLKGRYVDEYNLENETSISTSGLQLKQIAHSYIYEVSAKDENGNSVTKYVTHGSKPQETEDYLNSQGYSYRRIGNVEVLSSYNEYEDKLYESCFEDAYGVYHPILEGDNVSQINEPQTRNVLCDMGDCFYFVAHESKSGYIDELKDFYKAHKKNALPFNVVLDEPIINNNAQEL